MYATPALLTLVLLVLETVFLAVALPETRGKRIQPKDAARSSDKLAKEKIQQKATGASSEQTKQSTVVERLQTLRTLRRLHFLFLGVFSGVEFTLTFLTFDRKS